MSNPAELSTTHTPSKIANESDDTPRPRDALRDARGEIADAADHQWHALVIAALRATAATWQESAALCADVTWDARQNRRSIALTVPPGLVEQPDPLALRTLRHLHLTALRFDFRCRAILAAAPEPSTDLDPYTRAHLIAAELGLSRPASPAAMYRLLSDPSARNDPKVVHTLLHGLWLGEGLPHQADLTLALLRQAPFDPDADPIALYRAARAHRRHGDLDQALHTVERAFDVLPPGTPELHSDLVRERGLITLARDLRQPEPGTPPA